MAAYRFEDRRPSVDPSSFVHPQATLIGAVTIGPGCFVAAGARLRGDWGEIVVGAGCNVQDNCVLHAGPGDRVLLEEACHIGHGAILHGCTLRRHVTVGMGAIVQDGVEVGEECLIAAGAVLPPGLTVPPRKVVMGVPGRVAGDVGPELERRLWAGTRLYQALAGRCREGLAREEPDR